MSRFHYGAGRLAMLAILLLTPLALLHAQTVYEADAKGNAIEGTATKASCSGCLDGEEVTGIGNGSSNYLRIKNITAATSGTYTIQVFYLINGSSSFTIEINDSSSSGPTLNLTGTSTSKPASTSFTATFTAGSSNSVGFFNASKAAPAVDHIVVTAGSGGTPPPPGQTATPVLSPGSESFTSSASVTISDSTSGATIYYTTNGSTPTTSSTKYSGAITVTATETIEAIATASGDTNSAVASATYTLSSSGGGGTGCTSPCKTLNDVYTTLYGWPDNSPPGNAIAYPKSGGYPTIHNAAGGSGTFADPFTFATAASGDNGGQDPTSGEEPVGQVVYYPKFQKYFILEDECSGSGGSTGPSPGDSGNCEKDWNSGVYHFDLWLQSNGSENSDDVENCENDLTSNGNTETFYIGPPSGETVNTTPLYNASTGVCWSPS